MSIGAVFGLMIGIPIAGIITGGRADPLPTLANVSEIPYLFGIVTYMYKCHHCLPGVITPMKSKNRIFVKLFVTYILLLAFPLLLSYIAVFWLSTDELHDIYTLNFFTPLNTMKGGSISKKVLAILGYFIALYPVFSVSSVIPIDSVVLKENLKALSRLLLKAHWLKKKYIKFIADRLILPTLAILLPFIISFATTNVEALLSITGGVLGVWIQYFISTMLLCAGKRIITKRLRVEYKNKYKSPFSHTIYFIFVIAWTVVSVVFVLVGEVLKLVL